MLTPRLVHEQICARVISKGMSIGREANFCTCKQYAKEVCNWSKTEPPGFQKVGHENGHLWGNMARTSHGAIWNKEMSISTCATTSRRIRWSSCWKWMTSGRMNRAQHPKNVGVTIQTIERRPNLFEEIGKVAWWQARWLIEPPKDPSPNNLFNIILQNIWRWTHCTKQVTRMLGITQRKDYKSHLKICKHKETKYRPEILMENLSYKQLNKWCGSHWCIQNMKTRVGSKKVGRKWYKMVQPLKRLSDTLRWLHWKT